MPIEDDVEEFRIWATKLGCPSEAMPSEDALKSVFKSRQRDLFCNMMRRVRPRQEVAAIKKNILIHKVEKIRGQVVPVSERSFLPQEMQLHLTVQDLKKENKDMEQSLDERKKEYEALAASIDSKNIHIVNMENKSNLLEARVIMLDFKSEALDKDIKLEEMNKEKIKVTMPVLLTNETKSEQKATEAVQKALKELEEFYVLTEKNTNYQIIQEAKDNLWANMRKIFANIPNFLIFNNIMRLKEESLQHVMSLNKTINNESHLTGNNSVKPLTKFEINFLKTQASFMGIVCKYLTAYEENKRLEDDFVKAYQDFEDKLMEKVKIFNAHSEREQNEEIMRDYVVQFNLLNFTRGKYEFVKQQIDDLKAENENSKKYLKNHEVLLGSVKQVYADISASVNRIQFDMVQLSQIKDKIIHSKNIMKHQLEDLESNLGNSFEMGNDNVFCSTKLDFDSTMNTLNNTAMRSFAGSIVGSGGSVASDMTLLPQAQNTILPLHTLELMTFCETPLEHLSCFKKESSFYLSPNPLVTESRELSTTVQLAPGILLTPFGALQEVRNRIVWADLIAQHSNDLKLNLDTLSVDPQQYKQKIKEQHDQITETLDKIDVCSVNTIHSLQKLAKFYDFLIENPLRHFIPPSKCFNNQSYADYEAELLMYIRMATTGNSIK